MGNSSSVHRFSELSLLRRSLRATRASASAIPPTMAATSLPCTLCSCTNTNIYAWRQPQTSWRQTTTNLKVSQNLIMNNLILANKEAKALTAPATRVRASSQVVGVSWPDSSFTIGWVSLCLFNPSYANLQIQFSSDTVEYVYIF